MAREGRYLTAHRQGLAVIFDLLLLAACLPGRRLGLVLKVADGAGRAAPVALLALLRALDALDAQASTALAHRMRPELRNHAGVVVGHIEPVPGWPAWRQLS